MYRLLTRTGSKLSELADMKDECSRATMHDDIRPDVEAQVERIEKG